MKYSVVMPIKIEHPWQRVMTRCAIDTLRVTTELEYELVIVEYLTDKFAKLCETHVQIKEPKGPAAEFNIGCEAASGDYIIKTQNDIFTRPNWLECLKQCFDEISDCGIATLASADLRGKLPFEMPSNAISEGIYGPFMMFKKGWEFDAETFPCQFADTDMIMRIYGYGERSYRNFRCVIQHLNRQTHSGPDNDADFKEARKRFAAKHRSSPLLMYIALAGGAIL